MFVVCKLQNIGRKAGVYLFTCFIDLQKAYGTVDRILLWLALTRMGVPPQMIAVIRQIHGGMRACVRPDDGVCSDHPRQTGAPEGTADVDGTEAGYGLRLSCGVGYAVSR